MFLLVAGHPPWALPSPFVPGSRVLSVQCSRLPQLGLSLPQRIPCPLEDGEFVPPLVPDPSQIFKIKNPQVYSRPDPELPPSSQAQKLCSVEDPSKDCAAPLQEDVSAADLGANRNLSMKILHPQSKIVQIRRHYSTILKSDIQPHAARRLSVAERLNPPVWGRWATQPPSRSLVPRRDADVTTQGLNSRSSTTQVKEDQWSEVKPRFWWRKQQSFNPPNNQKPMHSRKQLFLKHVVRCFQWRYGVADDVARTRDSGAILNLLEKHLDPMLHEASIRNIVYSPDTSSSAPASPVFVLSSVAGNQAPEMVANQSVAADFLNNLSTPMQQPLLKMPKTKKRRPCLNKQYKKPLSPAAMKTISALVEKGGCKAIRLNGKGKGKVAQAPATTQT
ncbi:hypothetical protein OsJ_11631 [Oryza sativa Japonica Group]|uniref:Uncharacterized protein n=1 Tax=Oryza sativa subsp. japonica TaxID=39947 RepID=B9F9J9_ORYSJ|nr:hypothetical protein OsJ_11631 [Oryza sativa Japonica Group]